jgi:hypothetical protein
VDDENTKQGKSSFTLLVNLIERSITAHDADEIEVFKSWALLTVDYFPRAKSHSMVFYVACSIDRKLGGRLLHR